MRDILVRKPNEPTTVYVGCGHCGELVAQYKLASYYHHGRGVESFMRSRGASEVESGRRMLNEFNALQEEATKGYRDALDYLEKHGKPI